MYINLLPRGIRLKIQLRGARRRWGLIWAATAGVALLFYATQVRELLDVRAGLELLNTRCHALRSLQGEMNVDQEKLTGLLAEQKTLEQLRPNDHLLELLGVLTRATQPLAGKLRLQRLGLVAAPRPVVATTAQPPPAITQTGANQPTPTATLTLQGVADDGEALAQFVARLRASGVFQRVDLKSSNQSLGVGSTGRQYQLECRYEDQP